MSNTVTFGSAHDRFSELSDSLQSITDNLAGQLDAVRFETRAVTNSWGGAATESFLTLLGRFDAAEHDLIEVLRSITQTLRQAALDLAAQDHSAAMSLFGS